MSRDTNKVSTPYYCVSYAEFVWRLCPLHRHVHLTDKGDPQRWLETLILFSVGHFLLELAFARKAKSECCCRWATTPGYCEFRTGSGTNSQVLVEAGQ